MYAIGIDIGGTKIAGALVSEDGQIVREHKVPTPATDPEAIANAVVELVTELSTGVEVTAVGVAAAGFVDSERSTILYSPNLSWRNEPFKAELASRLKETETMIVTDYRGLTTSELADSWPPHVTLGLLESTTSFATPYVLPEPAASAIPIRA